MACILRPSWWRGPSIERGARLQLNGVFQQAVKKSVGNLPVYRVAYQVPGSIKQTPSLSDLVAKKRPMFAYEQEIRVVFFVDADDDKETIGQGVAWDPEKIVESIRVHPEADDSFIETATAVVEHYAPALKGRVARSVMNEPPPF